jgi:TetR/AcrR family acrAB operon transcriptional repressor
MRAKAAQRAARSEAAGGPLLPTREAILDAAERLFSEYGLPGVPMRDLAHALGLRPSSLYNHFKSKHALYEAVLARGLQPIAELIDEAWRTGGTRPEALRTIVERLVAHMALHPHLGQLLQRALLEDASSVRTVLERWVTPLYRDGMAVIREAATDAGWAPGELPHLALALFGVVFGYFINAPAAQRLVRSIDDPFSPDELAVQRAFLEKAIARLLGPHGRGTA